MKIRPLKFRSVMSRILYQNLRSIGSGLMVRSTSNSLYLLFSSLISFLPSSLSFISSLFSFLPIRLFFPPSHFFFFFRSLSLLFFPFVGSPPLRFFGSPFSLKNYLSLSSSSSPSFPSFFFFFFFFFPLFFSFLSYLFYFLSIRLFFPPSPFFFWLPLPYLLLFCWLPTSTFFWLSLFPQ